MRMEQRERRCALCGNPIGPGEAWLVDERADQLAHSGCVYRDEEPDARGRWSPGEASD
jgi:hypothetical protein